MVRYAIGVIIASAIFIAVVITVQSDQVIQLGLVALALGIMAFALFYLYVGLRLKLDTSNVDRMKQKHVHDERALELGFIPNLDGTYSPVSYLNEAPQGDAFIEGYNPAAAKEFSEAAYRLLIVTAQTVDRYGQGKYGPNQRQIMPFRLISRQDPYFKDYKVWRGAVQWLMMNRLAKQEMDGHKILGTFIKDGTIADALAKVPPPAGLLPMNPPAKDFSNG